MSEFYWHERAKEAPWASAMIEKYGEKLDEYQSHVLIDMEVDAKDTVEDFRSWITRHAKNGEDVDELLVELLDAWEGFGSNIIYLYDNDENIIPYLTGDDEDCELMTDEWWIDHGPGAEEGNV